MPDFPSRTGARLLADALRAHGVEMVFGIPGENCVDVLDALLDAPSIRPVTARQDGGAAVMAEAHGRLTGRPGIALVNGGPGAGNALPAVQTARQDGTPMILLIGQGAAPSGIDPCAPFAPAAKWMARIDRAESVPETVAQAFQAAMADRPGPVVLALPQGMLAGEAMVADTDPHPVEPASPAPGDLERIGALLARAERPLVVVGGPGWTDEACADLKTFAEANALPVCCAFRRQDILDNESPSHAGDLGTWPNPALAQRVADADLLLVLGAGLEEVAEELLTGKALIHAHPGAKEASGEAGGEAGGTIPAIQTGMAPMAAALAALPPVEAPCWTAWTESARADFLAWLEPTPCVGDLDLGWVFGWLRDRLPLDSIVAIDSGSFSNWPQRHLFYRRPGRQLAPANGAAGYAVPAAVAAKLAEPKRVVVGMTGDGGFLMNGQELATAVQTGAAVILIVVNNGLYGTARLHQEWRFPDRPVATGLTNPDFAALAEAHGAFGIAVERTEDFVPAFWDAMWSRKPAVIELRVDAEQITPGFTISQLRSVALASKNPE